MDQGPTCTAYLALKAVFPNLHREKIHGFGKALIYGSPTYGQCHDTYDTNLTSKSIAGPGMMLHFRFQLFFIISVHFDLLIVKFVKVLHVHIQVAILVNRSEDLLNSSW